MHLDSCTIASSVVTDDVSAHMLKAKAAYVNVGHFWRHRDVNLTIKGLVRTDLWYTRKTWLFQVENVQCLTMFSGLFLQRIPETWWQHHFSGAEFR